MTPDEISALEDRWYAYLKATRPELAEEEIRETALANAAAELEPPSIDSAGHAAASGEPQAPPWWDWKLKAVLWWEKDAIMEAFQKLLPGYKTTIVVTLGIALGLLCPLSWVVAHGIDCAWVDSIMTTLGFGAIAAVRAKVPVASGGKTTASVLAALALQVVSAFHGFDLASTWAAAHGIMVTPDALKGDLLQVLSFVGFYGIGDALKRYLEAAELQPAKA